MINYIRSLFKKPVCTVVPTPLTGDAYLIAKGIKMGRSHRRVGVNHIVNQNY
jgi:hypothetical protein